MPTQTRQRLIETAKQQFYRDGFRNVGIDGILSDVGISKTAFYKHFESKDDLMVAVLQEVDEFLLRHFREMVKERGGRTGEGQLRALMDVVEQIIEDEGFHGCIFVNAVMEFPSQNDPVHQVAAKHKRSIEEFVFELGERAGAAEPAALAQEMGIVMEGAYVTRTVTGTTAGIDIARRIANQIIDRHVPAAQD